MFLLDDLLVLIMTIYNYFYTNIINELIINNNSISDIQITESIKSLESTKSTESSGDSSEGLGGSSEGSTEGSTQQQLRRSDQRITNKLSAKSIMNAKRNLRKKPSTKKKLSSMFIEEFDSHSDLSSCLSSSESDTPSAVATLTSIGSKKAVPSKKKNIMSNINKIFGTDETNNLEIIDHYIGDDCDMDDGSKKYCEIIREPRRQSMSALAISEEDRKRLDLISRRASVVSIPVVDQAPHQSVTVLPYMDEFDSYADAVAVQK